MHQSNHTPEQRGVDVLPKFGDYISVEQKRYGGNNEFYTHKVIGTLRSNNWMDVPAITHEGMNLHDHMEDVVACICCGVCEEEVIRYRVKDVKIVQHGFPLPSKGQEGEAERKAKGMDELKIYAFQAKHIEDTLRIVANTLKSHSKETCLDRDVMQAWEFMKNVLSKNIDTRVKR